MRGGREEGRGGGGGEEGEREGEREEDNNNIFITVWILKTYEMQMMQTIGK